MTYCDLCNEFTSDPTDCDWCGHHVVARERPPTDVADLNVPRLTPDRRPFEEAIAPVRAARRSDVSKAVEWALARGHECDRDLLALSFELLDRFRCPDGYAIDRVDVTRLLTGGVINWTSMEESRIPDNPSPALWIALHVLAHQGALTTDSDPLAALLEPLQCYGGLDADGRERPDGVDVDFPCQCFVPHDPRCPDGLAQHLVGRDPDSFQPFITYAEMALRSADPPVSMLEPLFRITRRVRVAGGVFVPRADEFTYVGRIPESSSTPSLWMYRLLPVARRGFDPLVVDRHGRPFVPKPDRRRKAGYRWVSISDLAVMHVCGVAAREMETLEADDAWDSSPNRVVAVGAS